MMSSKSLRVTCLVLLASIFLSQVVSGADIAWNAASGNWHVAANWDPASVPTTNDIVTSTSGSANILLTNSPTAQLSGFTLNSGAITVENNLLANEIKILTGGSILVRAGASSSRPSLEFSSAIISTFPNLQKAQLKPGSLYIGESGGAEFVSNAMDGTMTNQDVIITNCQFQFFGDMIWQNSLLTFTDNARFECFLGTFTKTTVNFVNSGYLTVPQQVIVSDGSSFIFQDDPTGPIDLKPYQVDLDSWLRFIRTDALFEEKTSQLSLLSMIDSTIDVQESTLNVIQDRNIRPTWLFQTSSVANVEDSTINFVNANIRFFSQSQMKLLRSNATFSSGSAAIFESTALLSATDSNVYFKAMTKVPDYFTSTASLVNVSSGLFSVTGWNVDATSSLILVDADITFNMLPSNSIRAPITGSNSNVRISGPNSGVASFSPPASIPVTILAGVSSQNGANFSCPLTVTGELVLRGNSWILGALSGAGKISALQSTLNYKPSSGSIPNLNGASESTINFVGQAGVLSLSSSSLTNFIGTSQLNSITLQDSAVVVSSDLTVSGAATLKGSSTLVITNSSSCSLTASDISLEDESALELSLSSWTASSPALTVTGTFTTSANSYVYIIVTSAMSLDASATVLIANLPAGLTPLNHIFLLREDGQNDKRLGTCFSTINNATGTYLSYKKAATCTLFNLADIIVPVTEAKKPSSGLTGGAKAGIAIGVIVFVALLAVAGFLIWKNFLKDNSFKYEHELTNSKESGQPANDESRQPSYANNNGFQRASTPTETRNTVDKSSGGGWGRAVKPPPV